MDVEGYCKQHTTSLHHDVKKRLLRRNARDIGASRHGAGSEEFRGKPPTFQWIQVSFSRCGWIFMGICLWAKHTWCFLQQHRELPVMNHGFARRWMFFLHLETTKICQNCRYHRGHHGGPKLSRPRWIGSSNHMLKENIRSKAPLPESTSTHQYVYVCMSINVHVHIYVYMYLCIRAYVYADIYIYIYPNLKSNMDLANNSLEDACLVLIQWSNVWVPWRKSQKQNTESGGTPISIPYGQRLKPIKPKIERD